MFAQQEPDGKWSDVPRTGFVLIKLQDRAYELGYDSPFDPSYAYSDNVTAGWEYLFTAGGANDGTYAKKQAIGTQDHTAGASGTVDDPDTNRNGYGIYFTGNTVYHTGICLMALTSSGTPNRPNDGGIDYDGDGNPDTFGEIAQDVTDWLAFAQCDSGTCEGGYYYSAQNNQGGSADNSVSGYAYLGLAAAEGFGCTVPDWVKTELNGWITYIQCTTPGADYGGSGYSTPCSWVNELKTGNLIFEMAFYGDGPGDARFDDAKGYIENHWQDSNLQPGWGYNQPAPVQYQAMYCLMKGLEYSGVHLIDTDGDSFSDDDWFNQEPSASPAEDLASVLVAQQNLNGSWPSSPCYVGTNGVWGPMSGTVLSTVWALLTLEKVTPPPHQPPAAPAPVPAMSPIGIIALISVLGFIGAGVISRRR